jgi:hypothetical protein
MSLFVGSRRLKLISSMSVHLPPFFQEIGLKNWLIKIKKQKK